MFFYFNVYCIISAIYVINDTLCTREMIYLLKINISALTLEYTILHEFIMKRSSHDYSYNLYFRYFTHTFSAYLLMCQNLYPL